MPLYHITFRQFVKETGKKSAPLHARKARPCMQEKRAPARKRGQRIAVDKKQPIVYNVFAFVLHF